MGWFQKRIDKLRGKTAERKAQKAQDEAAEEARQAEERSARIAAASAASQANRMAGKAMGSAKRKRKGRATVSGAPTLGAGGRLGG